MAEGQHRSRVNIDARVDSANKEIKKLSGRLHAMEREVEKADKRGARMGRTYDGLGKKLKSVGPAIRNIGIAATAAAAGVFRLVDAQTAALDEAAKGARAAGVSVKTYQRLAFAADRSGVAMSSVAKGSVFLEKALQDVSRGAGAEAADALERLNLAAEDFRGKTYEERLGLIADSLQDVADDQEKAAITMRLLGRTGSDMATLLADGSEGIRILGDEAERLGNVFSEEETAKAEQFQDALTDVKTEAKAIATFFSVKLIPTMQWFLDLVGARDGTVVALSNYNRALADHREVLKDVEATTAEEIGTILRYNEKVDTVTEGVNVLHEAFEDGYLDRDQFVEALDRAKEEARLLSAEIRDLTKFEAEFRRETVKTAEALGRRVDAQGRMYGASFLEQFQVASRADRERRNKLDAARIESTKKRRTGGSSRKRDDRPLLEQSLEAFEPGDRSELEEAQAAFRHDILGIPTDKEKQEAAEARKEAADNLIDFEQRKAEIVLQQRMRAIEEQRAAGVDPLTLIEREKEARLEQIEAEIAAAKRRDGLTEQSIEVQELREQQEQVRHQATLARMQEERAELRETAQTYWDFAGAMGNALGQASLAAIRASGSSRRAFFDSIKSFAEAKAIESTLLGLTETAKAIAAYASYNYAGGAAHTAAAGKAFAVAAIAGSVAAGATAIGGGLTRSTGGPTGFEPSPAIGGGGGGAANEGPRSSFDEDAIPASPDSATSGAQAGQSGASQSAAAPMQFFVVGQIDDRAALKIAQATDKVRRRRRSA